MSKSGIVLALVCAIAVLISSCSTEIDREFGPSSLQGTGALPGLVITSSVQTGV